MCYLLQQNELNQAKLKYITKFTGGSSHHFRTLKEGLNEVLLQKDIEGRGTRKKSFHAKIEERERQMSVLYSGEPLCKRKSCPGLQSSA